MEESTPATKVEQSVSGEGNIFSGSGDIRIVQQLSAGDPDDRRGLAILRQRVQQFWIDDVLDESLHGLVLIELGQSTMDSAIENPWAQVIALPDKPNCVLPPGTKIQDVYHERGKSLLILGEPGSGKTTTLLQLARSLLSEAAADDERPVPVIFNLSIWSKKRSPLFVWLIEELKIRYRIPRWQGERWLQKGRLILLLDALDEVPAASRAACVEAIKKYEHSIPGIAVCSRLEEYTALPVRVNLDAAICIQPLSLAQVDVYLRSAGARLASLRQSIANDPDLQTTLQSPLMLSITCLASANYLSTVIKTTRANTEEERRAAIFDAYIENMFQRRVTAAPPYSKQRTLVWLCWLARMMIGQSQTLFQLDELQPIVLPSNKWRLVYCFVSRLLAGIGFFFPPDPVTSGLTFTTMVSDFVTLRSDAVSRKIHRNVALYSVLTYLGIGVILAVLTEHGEGAAAGAFTGVFFGVPFALCFGIVGGWRSASSDIHLIERVRWSWRMAFTGFAIGIVAGLLFVALLWTINPPLQSYFEDNSVGARVLFAFKHGLTYGLPMGGAGFLVFGFLRRTVKQRFGPNTTIRHSLIFSLLCASVSACAGILMQPWVPDLFSDFLKLPVQICLGLAYFTGLCCGGYAVIRHITLRTILVCQGAMPTRYRRFLEYATSLIFLRRAGGAYIFLHRSLMEHLAKRAI